MKLYVRLALAQNVCFYFYTAHITVSDTFVVVYNSCVG